MSHKMMLGVGQLVVECPARAEVLETFGIDWACAGRRTLSQLCIDKGLEGRKVLEGLAAAEAAGAGRTELAREVLARLINHLREVHHAYLRRKLPEVAGLIAAAVVKQAEERPELPKLAQAFEVFWRDVEKHMRAEEEVVFPYCEALASGKGAGAAGAAGAAGGNGQGNGQSREAGGGQSGGEQAGGGQAGGKASDPIHAMIMEHDENGHDLERIRMLTDDYTVPAVACEEYRRALEGLKDIESDLHRHVYEENNILAPMAMLAAAR